MRYFLGLMAVLLLGACQHSEPTSTISREEAIQEIYKVEQAFNDLLAKEGRAVAFSHFAAEDGGILRNGEMIIGKQAIYDHYAEKTSINVKLVWKPDRVDISDDFTMASTWGKFDYSGERLNGETFASKGIFHTVWKRQKDGTWRYIYD